MSRLLSTGPCSWYLGALHQHQNSFVVNEDQLSRHLGVFGGSGSGKSKFLELLCRRMIDDYRGFCFIDPHGDTSEDLLAYCAQRTETLRTDAVCKRIHYLEPTFETVFGFDPFEFRPATDIPEHLRENAYHAWLHTKADKVSEVVQRKQGQGDFQGMARLQRILRDVLIAVGTTFDKQGRHLPLSDVLVLLDTYHLRHKDVLELVRPHLPPEVRADFASLGAYKFEEQRKKETESTINRLRSLLSPIVKAIFTNTAQTIDFRKIITNRGVVLVNLRKTDFFSADQRNAIGGLLIHEILSAVETAPRENRVPFYLIVDEARLFLGEDLMEALDQARKFKLSLCLAGQHLSQFKTKEFDMTPSILNNCGSVLCFQQKHPEDLKIWKEYFGYANLSFEKHFQIMDRQKGYDFLEVQDWSETESSDSRWGLGASVSESDGGSHADNASFAQQTGLSQNWNSQSSRSNTDTAGTSDSTARSKSVTRSPIIVNGQVVGYTENETAGRNEGLANARSQSDTQGESEGKGVGINRSVTETHGTADGQNWSKGKGLSANIGGSESHGVTINHKKIPVPRMEEELHETPNLINSVDDQFHQFAHLQRVLPQRHALASVVGVKESFVIKVADVPDVYSAKDLPAKLAAMKQKIFALHPYYSTPNLSPEAQDKRLDDFLRSATDEPRRVEHAHPDDEENPPFGV